jgi:signal peptidase I
MVSPRKKIGRHIVANALILLAGTACSFIIGLYFARLFSAHVGVATALLVIIFLFLWGIAARRNLRINKIAPLSKLQKAAVVLVALALGMILRTFLFQPFHMVAGGMKPTLFDRDYILVSKYSYGFSHYSLPFSPPLFRGRLFAFFQPERGDIVVFRLPKNDQNDQNYLDDWVSRIIGLPGDRIQMIGGLLFINGQPVERERIEDYVETTDDGRVTRVKRWRETLPNGISHTTFDLVDNGFYDNTPVYVVPAGHYFAMGDNRDNTTDSRLLRVGFVPYENVLGPIKFIFWPNTMHLPIWRSFFISPPSVQTSPRSVKTSPPSVQTSPPPVQTSPPSVQTGPSPQTTSGTFDGRWSATIGPQGACNFTSTLTLDVAGSSIVGSATNPSGVFPLSGTVDASGTGDFKIGAFVGTIKFSGTTFEANYANQCGKRFAIGTKQAAGGEPYGTNDQSSKPATAQNMSNAVDNAINRANVYANSGDYDLAIAAYNEVIRLDPKYALAWSNRGKVYEKKGELQRALTDYKSAISLNPSLEAAVEGAKRVSKLIAQLDVTKNAHKSAAPSSVETQSSPATAQNTAETEIADRLYRAMRTEQIKQDIAARKEQALQTHSVQIGLFQPQLYSHGMGAHFVIQNYSNEDIRDVTLSCTTTSGTGSSFDFEQKVFGAIKARSIAQFSDIGFPKAFSSGSLSCRVTNFEWSQ